MIGFLLPSLQVLYKFGVTKALFKDIDVKFDENV